MQRKRTFGLVYWGILIIVMVLVCASQGQEEFVKCKLEEGRVIDQVRLSTGRGKYRRDVMRPQIIFPVGDTSFIFSDERTRHATGEVVTVIYPKVNPRDASVYTFWFWIDLGIIVPFLLIGGFVYAMIVISFTNYGKKPIILKGELDDFVNP